MPSKAAERQWGYGAQQRWMPTQAAEASWSPTQAAEDWTWTPTQSPKASWTSAQARTGWIATQAEKASWTSTQNATEWTATQATKAPWTPMPDWTPTQAAKASWTPAQAAKDWTPTQAAKGSWADVSDEPVLVSPQSGAPERKTTSEAMKFGPSILKEIFPDHGKITDQILDRIPSPSRARTRKVETGSFQGNCSPAGRELHLHHHHATITTMPPAPVHMPPPQSPMSRQWEAPQLMSTPPPAPAFGGSAPAFGGSAPAFGGSAPAFGGSLSAFGGSIPALGGSYRDRLRAGGRGALQRSADAGFVPRPTHQEWGATQMAPTYDQSFTTHQPELQNGAPTNYSFTTHQPELQNGAPMAMDYGVASDQLMWSGHEQLPSDEFWGASMTSPPYQHMQQGPIQEVPDFYQPPMAPQSGASMSSPQYPHMQQGPMQEVPDFYQQPMVPQSQELMQSTRVPQPDFYQQPMVPQSQELLLPVMPRHYSETQSIQELLLPVMPRHYSETQSMMQMGPMTPHSQMAPHGQMGPMTPHSQMGPITPQMPSMQVQLSQMDMTQHSQMGPITPQMPSMQVQLAQMENCGEFSPAECMAIVMPGAAAQFQGSTARIDKDLMALQLKAAAELQQCYED